MEKGTEKKGTDGLSEGRSNKGKKCNYFHNYDMMDTLLMLWTIIIQIMLQVLFDLSLFSLVIIWCAT